MPFFRDRFGNPDVDELLAKNKLKGLINALSYKKDGDKLGYEMVRSKAAAALGGIDDVRTVEPLITALDDKSESVRIYVTYALWETAKRVKDASLRARIVERLITALKDHSPKVRGIAASALGKTRGTHAVEQLILLLRDSENDVQDQAASSLDQLKWKPGIDAGGACYWIVKKDWEKCLAIGAPAAEPLVYALRDNDDQASIINILVNIGVPAVNPLIASIIKSKDKVKVTALGEVIANINDDELRNVAAEPLLAALEYGNNAVRIAAAEALGKIRCIAATKPLIAWLTSENVNIRIAVINALGDISDPIAAKPLVDSLQDNDTQKVTSVALLKIGKPAEKPLLEKLKDSNKDVRKVAALLLDKLSWKPTKDENGARYWIALEEWGKCAAIGAPAVEIVIPMLKVKEMRTAAIEILGNIGAPAVGPLLVLLHGEKEHGREAVMHALGKIGRPAIEDLLLVLKNEDMGERKWAVESLADIGKRLEDPSLRTRTIESLEAALNDSEKGVRQTVLIALGKMGDAGSLQLLLTALDDNDKFVRIAAKNALDLMGWKPGKDADGARYWIEDQEFSKCTQIGAPAVKPLLKTLMDREILISFRELAAQVLVKMYKSDLNPNEKQLILAQVETIKVLSHNDRPHYDEGSACMHNDIDYPSKQLFHADFPL